MHSTSLHYYIGWSKKDTVHRINGNCGGCGLPCGRASFFSAWQLTSRDAAAAALHHISPASTAAAAASQPPPLCTASIGNYLTSRWGERMTSMVVCTSIRTSSLYQCLYWVACACLRIMARALAAAGSELTLI